MSVEFGGFEREMRSVSRHPPRLYPGKGARTPPLSRVGSSSHTAHLQASSPKYLLCVDRIYSFTYPPYRFTPSPYYGYRVLHVHTHAANAVPRDRGYCGYRSVPRHSARFREQSGVAHAARGTHHLAHRSKVCNRVAAQRHFVGAFVFFAGPAR